MRKLDYFSLLFAEKVKERFKHLLNICFFFFWFSRSFLNITPFDKSMQLDSLSGLSHRESRNQFNSWKKKKIIGLGLIENFSFDTNRIDMNY